MRVRPPHRFWPQKVRARLTLSYAALFLVAGTILLALTYGLLAASLPTRPPAGLTISSQVLHAVHQACQSTGVSIKGNPVVKDLSGCKEAMGAYFAGTAAGFQAQRQAELSKPLSFALVGLGVMTVASGGLGWAMSGRVLHPVRVITETARRASEQHLGERLNLAGAKDELKELVRSSAGAPR
jgi:two-component system sensor histidine kinase VanS